jgi:hypothetical protein
MNLVQIQSRVQELPNSAQTMQYLNAAMNGQVTTVPPYIAAAELKRRETEGMMDKLAQGAAQASASTVKDQLQQKMGIMALMGRQQPPQPPRIPQPAPPEQQPEAGGIDSLPVNEDMFGMADGGIVGYSGGGDVQRFQTGGMGMGMGMGMERQPPISLQELTRLYQQDPKRAREAALRAGPAGARMLEQVGRFARVANPVLLALEGGAAVSGVAANFMEGMTPEQRRDFYGNPMLGAMGGDAGLAAAILNAPNMKPPESSSGSQIGKPPEAAAQVPPALRAQYLREVEEMGSGKRMQFSPEIKQALPEIRQALAADTAADQKASLQREQDMAKQRTAALGISSASPAAAQKSVGTPSVLNAPSAVEVTGTPPPRPAPGAAAAAGNRPPAAAGNRPPTAAAARPPTDGGINLADLAPGASPTAQADALEMSPSYQRMLKLANAANPYGGPQETQQQYIDRRNQGILSQIPGGKKPYETSEARLKEIEARRAKEDTDYAESNKGRQLDNLLTFISGMGRGSFGNAGVQGIEAVQKVERSQREEDLRRKDLRDQQSMKLMEIRTLNDQAQYAEATGNITEFDRLKREIKKLENEYTFKQAELDKELTTIGATARSKDSDVAANKEKLKEESRQKQLERDKDIQVERIRVAGQASARASGADDKTVKMAEDAFTRDPEAQAIKKRLESSVNPAKRQTDLDRLREIQAAKYRQFGITLEGAPSTAPAAGGNTRMRFDAQGNPIK